SGGTLRDGGIRSGSGDGEGLGALSRGAISRREADRGKGGRCQAHRDRRGERESRRREAKAENQDRALKRIKAVKFYVFHEPAGNRIRWPAKSVIGCTSRIAVAPCRLVALQESTSTGSRASHAGQAGPFGQTAPGFRIRRAQEPADSAAMGRGASEQAQSGRGGASGRGPRPHERASNSSRIRKRASGDRSRP